MDWDWGENALRRKNFHNLPFQEYDCNGSRLRLNSVYFLFCPIRKVSQFKALEKQTYARMFSATKKGMKSQCTLFRTNLNLT